MNSSIINNLDIIDFAKDCNVFDIDLFENEKFGVVKVYGNEDQPALFLKEVDSFNFKTLKQIAEIQKASWNFQKVLFLYVYTKQKLEFTIVLKNLLDMKKIFKKMNLQTN